MLARFAKTVVRSGWVRSKWGRPPLEAFSPHFCEFRRSSHCSGSVLGAGYLLGFQPMSVVGRAGFCGFISRGFRILMLHPPSHNKTSWPPGFLIKNRASFQSVSSHSFETLNMTMFPDSGHGVNPESRGTSHRKCIMLSRNNYMRLPERHI